MLVGEQRCDHCDAEPVEPAEVQAEAHRGEQHHRQHVQQAGAPENAFHAEAHRHGVQALLDVELAIEQRIEQIEPAIQTATAAPSAQASHGSRPVIATQAPTGASPSTTLSQM